MQAFHILNFSKNGMPFFGNMSTNCTPPPPPPSSRTRQQYISSVLSQLYILPPIIHQRKQFGDGFSYPLRKVSAIRYSLYIFDPCPNFPTLLTHPLLPDCMPIARDRYPYRHYRGSNDSTESLSNPPPTTPMKTNAKTPTVARVVPAVEPWLTEAGTRFREGKLVAFPTGDFL